MPNANRSLGIYVPTGNPDTVNVSSLYRQGELGTAYDYNDRAYQIVQLDSGATVANAVGVVAANQLAFWKDKDKYLVTNDKRFAIGGPTSGVNQIAGIFRNAATAGNYCHILQRGDYIPVASHTSPDAIGEYAVGDTTADVNRIIGINVGTAPTHQAIGVARTVVSANVTYVDVDIPNIP